MNIYVASSWRNKYQPGVVERLRSAGHEVYDFRDENGFNWSEIDPGWQDWSPEQYINGLCHPRAAEGFTRDMNALRKCDVCLFVMPCGMSASLKAGFACGQNKHLIVYVPELCEPDLMVRMANVITYLWHDVEVSLQEFARTKEARGNS